jgi:hypothetical protein
LPPQQEESHRTIDPLCLENPRPEGAESFPEFPEFVFPSAVASLSGSDDADQVPEADQADRLLFGNTWIYLRLVAYSFFGLSERV